MRYAKRVDANQSEIIKAFESLHCQVVVIGEPVDLIVYMPFKGVWQNIFVEVKDGNKVKSARKLTGQQVEFFNSWRGPKIVITSVDDVIAAITSPTEKP